MMHYVLMYQVFGVALEAPFVISCWLYIDVSTGDDAAEVEDDVTEEEPVADLLQFQPGSLCSVCSICDHCSKNCDNCPCEDGDESEQCEHCQECSSCYLCPLLCDTICTPGGLIDELTGSLFQSFSALLWAFNTSMWSHEVLYPELTLSRFHTFQATAGLSKELHWKLAADGKQQQAEKSFVGSFFSNVCAFWSKMIAKDLCTFFFFVETLKCITKMKVYSDRKLW